MKEINWNVVEDNIARNKNYRVCWRAYLGNSLTRIIGRCKAMNYTAEQTYKYCIDKQPDLPQELKRRLIIGIAARYGEAATIESEKLKQTTR